MPLVTPGSLPGGPSPMTPGPQAGLEAQAMLKVRQAVLLLAEAVPLLKTKLDSDLGRAVLDALKKLAGFTPGVEQGLGQAELASMQQALQPVRPPSPTLLGTARPAPAALGTVGPSPAPLPPMGGGPLGA